MPVNTTGYSCSCFQPHVPVVLTGTCGHDTLGASLPFQNSEIIFDRLKI